MRSSSSGSRMLKHFDDDGDTQTLTLPTIERSIVELILIPPTTASYFLYTTMYVLRLRADLMPRLRDDVRQLKCLFLTNYCLIAATLNLNEKPFICITFNGNIVQQINKKKSCFKWLTYFFLFFKILGTFYRQIACTL